MPMSLPIWIESFPSKPTEDISLELTLIAGILQLLNKLFKIF